MAIALVQHAANFAGAAKAFTNPNAAGNLIVAMCFGNSGTGFTASDTNSNTYSSAVPFNQDTFGCGQMIYAPNCAAGANTVTVARVGGTGSVFGMCIAEFSGVATSSPVDSSILNTSGATGNPSGSISPTVAGVIVAGVYAQTNPTAAGTGFTQTDLGGQLGMEYKIVSTSGSVTVGFTMSGSNQWDLKAASFKQATATSLFLPDLLNGLGSGGSFFRNPLG